MIGAFSDHADAFLHIMAVMTAIVFSIPIALAPLHWAKVFRWSIDAQPHLALYFGRSLGAVAIVLSWAMWHAAGHPELQPFFFKILIGIGAFMSVVHVVGAVQRVQPWTETMEIAFWGAVALLGLVFYPVT